jgi:hypothetical protein
MNRIGAGKFAGRLWEFASGANWRHRFQRSIMEEAREVATVSFADCLASKPLSLLRYNNAITNS